MKEIKKYYPFVVLGIFIVLGFLLRIWSIGDNYYFNGELGKELLFVRNFVVSGNLPLVGMPTSHEWLSYGPFYYWIMIPVFKVFSGDPFILFWSSVVVAVVGLLVNYFVVKQISDKSTALVSTIIQSISPLMIWQTRLSKLHVFFWVLVPIFIYFMSLLWKGKKKYAFWTGLIFGLMFSFHFSQIPFFAVVLLLFFFRRKILAWTDLLKFLAGAVLPNLTLLWQDKNILAWLPYRVVSYGAKDPWGTLYSFNEFLGKLVFWDKYLWITGSVVGIYFVYIFVKNNYRKIQTDFFSFIIITTLGSVFLANFLHSTPPVHYFLPVFTILPILYGFYLGKHKLYLLPILLVLAVNIFSFSGDPLFYKKIVGIDKSVSLVPYVKQLGVTSIIVNDARGTEFSLVRHGPYDYFPEQYSQNYKYLIIWKGGKLVDSSSNVYTITEDPESGVVYVGK